MTPLIQFNCQLLKQARDVIKAVDNTELEFSAMVGPHLRHVIEHYQLLLEGVETGQVDYERRTRGGCIESDPEAALSAIAELEDALTHRPLPMDAPIKAEFAVGMVGEEQMAAQSSLGRELQFVGLHAIHHYAFVALALKEAHIALPDGFGIAPGTRRYTTSTEDAASAA
ncbi:MAG: hypothetical protein OXT49_08810 [Gammaproteobacteria bacterium]|nr:hypothetical protein [Gammaproteobacteria bacterium]